MKKKLFRERYYENNIGRIETFENKIEKPEDVKVVKPTKKGKKNDKSNK